MEEEGEEEEKYEEGEEEDEDEDEDGEEEEDEEEVAPEWIPCASSGAPGVGESLQRDNECTCPPARTAERPAGRPVSLREAEHTCCVARRLSVRRHSYLVIRPHFCLNIKLILILR